MASRVTPKESCRQCDGKVYARGVCKPCYMRAFRKGNLPDFQRKEERCSVCQSPLRPYNSRKGDWPGTKAKASSNPLLCTAHQYGKGSATQDFTGHVVPVVPVEEVRIVRRLIVDRFDDPDDRNLMISMVIGDDID